jgi:hypothetical protein
MPQKAALCYVNGEKSGLGILRIQFLYIFGSQMAMTGADPFAIMKAMGHTRFKTT